MEDYHLSLDSHSRQTNSTANSVLTTNLLMITILKYWSHQRVRFTRPNGYSKPVAFINVQGIASALIIVSQSLLLFLLR
ncbi:hypothetical protein [Coleofasciculus sp. F4-SAH-05]|uniref:hypothetical protein n=1 Tax=Coleofasciculus sp. F4-SAH-05 TaxID=3069525 RepID=UPI0033030813